MSHCCLRREILPPRLPPKSPHHHTPSPLHRPEIPAFSPHYLLGQSSGSVVLPHGGRGGAFRTSDASLGARFRARAHAESLPFGASEAEKRLISTFFDAMQGPSDTEHAPAAAGQGQVDEAAQPQSSLQFLQQKQQMQQQRRFLAQQPGQTAPAAFANFGRAPAQASAGPQALFGKPANQAAAGHSSGLALPFSNKPPPQQQKFNLFSNRGGQGGQANSGLVPAQAPQPATEPRKATANHAFTFNVRGNGLPFNFALMIERINRHHLRNRTVFQSGRSRQALLPRRTSRSRNQRTTSILPRVDIKSSR